MTINSGFTFGHKIAQQGSSTTYIGSTNTEGLAIGQQVSDSAKTSVDVSDKLVISDLDSTPNLEIGFRQFAGSPHLSVTNRSGEFETSTSIPMNLQPSEMENASDLAWGFNVNRVSVENRDGVGTFVSLADTSGIGERAFLVTPDGKLQAFLREA